MNKLHSSCECKSKRSLNGSGCYFTGRLFYQGWEGRLNSDCYAAFLALVMEQTDQHLVLVQDGAKYHTSAAMKSFFEQHTDRLTVFQLPSYSPDYTPIEKLWKKIKQQETHLHYFPTFAALTEKNEVITQPLRKAVTEKGQL